MKKQILSFAAFAATVIISLTFLSCEQEPSQEIHKFEVQGLQKEIKKNEIVPFFVEMEQNNVETSKIYFFNKNNSSINPGSIIIEPRKEFSNPFSGLEKNNIFNYGTISEGYVDQNKNFIKGKYAFYIKAEKTGNFELEISVQNYKDLRRSYKKSFTITVKD